MEHQELRKCDIINIGVDIMISRIKNQVNLYAASEVFNEFIVSNKTF